MPKTKTSKSSKKTKKSKSKKISAQAEDNKVVENVENVETVENVEKVVESTRIKLETSNDIISNSDDNNVDDVKDKTLISRIDHHQSVLQEIKKLLISELSALKELRKAAKQETKKKKRKNSGGKKSNSGIMRKFKLEKHPELAEFMESDIASRVDVLTKVSKYSKEYNLQAEDNKRRIILDDKLSKIFPELVGKEGDERLAYTSIMKHISKFFPKQGQEGYDEAIVDIDIDEGA